ncbi:MAG TPA: LuxR C-terminal-related transcriptional regulator [Candidatus Baltobacteraceae bacterium]|nr:LuxR C-terminal-related transcriptional regulator [Candidatus Baltobacteraceae bacterium]
MSTTTDTFSRRLTHLHQALEQADAPLDVLAALVDALLECGDRAGALQAFRRYAGRYENGDPKIRTRLRALHERVLWNAPAGALHTNVPTSRYVIVGREAETYAVVEQLRSAPVVCVTGPGGVGKTRIALEVARRVLPEYADGVWWVDFSPVEDGAYCAEHVAHTLNLSLFEATPAALAESLSAKSCVLVLDRCERITDAVRALVDEIRRRALKLRVLLTSRRVTGASGEIEMRIEPLDVPDPKHGRAAALRSAAVQLFVERAAAADARFALTDDNAAAIAALCRQLGGLPLAIELAASSAAHLPLGHIARRVNGNHDDLRETIAWSYELLDQAERATLRKLSIFVAPFTFEEAEAANARDVSHTLKRLIDASLVQTRVEHGIPEYYLLDSMRDFARAQLEAAGEAPDAYRSLLAYFTRLALQGEAALEKLDAMFAKAAYVLTALSGDDDSLEERLTLLGVPGTRFGTLGHVEETARLCEDALHNVPSHVRVTRAHAGALRTLSWLCNRRGRFVEAIETAEQSVEIALALGDSALAVRALSNAYVASINTGQYDAARTFSDRALALAREIGDAATLANALRAAGGSRVAVGDFEDALPFYDELLALDLGGVPATVLAMALHDYALARLHLGHAKVAKTLAERSLQLSSANGDYGTEADALNVLGVIALGEGTIEEALRRYRASLALANRPGMHPTTAARTLEGCAASALRDDQLDAAAQILGHAQQMRRRFRSPLQPFERDKAQGLDAAFTSRLGAERFEAGLLAGRTRSFGEICALVTQLGAGSAPPDKAERFAVLTAREREIAELAAAAASNREISAQLHLSVRTVENHLATIYRKLGIKTRAEL